MLLKKLVWVQLYSGNVLQVPSGHKIGLSGVAVGAPGDWYWTLAVDCVNQNGAIVASFPGQQGHGTQKDMTLVSTALSDVGDSIHLRATVDVYFDVNHTKAVPGSPAVFRTGIVAQVVAAQPQAEAKWRVLYVDSASLQVGQYGIAVVVVQNDGNGEGPGTCYGLLTNTQGVVQGHFAPATIASAAPGTMSTVQLQTLGKISSDFADQDMVVVASCQVNLSNYAVGSTVPSSLHSMYAFVSPPASTTAPVSSSPTSQPVQSSGASSGTATSSGSAPPSSASTSSSTGESTLCAQAKQALESLKAQKSMLMQQYMATGMTASQAEAVYQNALQEQKNYINQVCGS